MRAMRTDRTAIWPIVATLPLLFSTAHYARAAETQSDKLSVESAQLRLVWDPAGKLLECRVCGKPVAQTKPNQFYLNGHAVDRATTSATGDREVTQVAEVPGGTLKLVWRGGKHVEVTVIADVPTAEVKEAGFSLGLPPGDLHTYLGGQHAWAGTPDGRVVTLDDLDFGIGLGFLLQHPDHCLRLGRQVKLRRDYTVGHIEKTQAAGTSCGNGSRNGRFLRTSSRSHCNWLPFRPGLRPWQTTSGGWSRSWV